MKDEDLEEMTSEQLKDEVRKLRAAIRNHRDSEGHNLCWYVPELWNLLPETVELNPPVPEPCEFIANCVKYRQSLDVKYQEYEERFAKSKVIIIPLSEAIKK